MHRPSLTRQQDGPFPFSLGSIDVSTTQTQTVFQGDIDVLLKRHVGQVDDFQQCVGFRERWKGWTLRRGIGVGIGHVDARVSDAN